MRIQIDVKGAGAVSGYHFYDGEAVPRVGETVSTEHLGELGERLGFPDDGESWVVEEVQWYFGDVANDMECDVLVWVTNKHLRKSLDAFFDAAKWRFVMSDEGAALIAAERFRQVHGEGWGAVHDDRHVNGELAKAAACYANPSLKEGHSEIPYDWPFEPEWWKPSPDNRISELVKAGALIAAEIDRLQRLARDGHG